MAKIDPKKISALVGKPDAGKLLPQLRKLRDQYKHRAMELKGSGKNPGEVRKDPSMMKIASEYSALSKKFESSGGGGPAQAWVFETLSI